MQSKVVGKILFWGAGGEVAWETAEQGVWWRIELAQIAVGGTSVPWMPEAHQTHSDMHHYYMMTTCAEISNKMYTR